MRRWSLLALGSLIVALLALSAWILWSESGLRFISARLVKLAPVSIEYQSISGSLMDEISLSEFRIDEQAWQLELETLRFRVSPFALLRRELVLSDLKMQSLQVRIPGASSASSADEGEPAASQGWEFPEPSLPVRLNISRVLIDDASLVVGEAASGKSYEVEQISVGSARYRDSAWTASGFALAAPNWSLSGDSSYLAAGEHDTRIDLKSNIQVAEKNIEIDTSLTGNEREFVLNQKVRGMVEAELQVELQQPTSGGDWSMGLTASSENLRTLLPELPDLAPASLRIEGEGSGQTGRLKGAVMAPANRTVEFFVAFDSLLPLPLIRKIELADTGSERRLGFEGSLQLAGGLPQANGTLSWRQLSWPLFAEPESSVFATPAGEFTVQGEDGRYAVAGEAELASETASGMLRSRGEINLSEPLPSFLLAGDWDRLSLRIAERELRFNVGTYRLEGNVEDYAFAAGLNAQAEDAPAVRLELAGSGNARSVSLTSLTAVSDAGELSASGQMALTADKAFSLNFSGRRINPGAFDRRWPGRLAVEGKVAGSYSGDGLSGQLREGRLRGQLRGLTLQASVELAMAQAGLTAIDVEGSWGSSRLMAEGSLQPRRDLRWSLDIPDLSAHTDRGTGSLTSNGEVGGSADSPSLVAQATVRTLTYPGIKMDRADLDIRLDAVDEAASTLSFGAEAVTFRDTHIDEVEMEVTGTAASHSGLLNVGRHNESLSTRFSGAWQDSRWQGEIEESTLMIADSPWQQSESATARLQGDSFELEKLCLAHELSRVCVGGAYREGEPNAVTLEAENIPMAKLTSLLPAGLGYAGSLSGSARLSGDTGEANFNVDKARVSQRVADEEQVLLDYARLGVTAELASKRLALELRGVEPGQRSLSVTVDWPFENWAVVDGPVSGRIAGTMENLGAVSFLFPDLADLHGRLEADLELTGTTAAPVWDGEIVLSDGRAQAPTLGLTFPSISGRLRAAGTRLTGTMSVSSGDGELRLAGDLTPGMDGASGQLTVRGEKFLASNLPEARVVVTPDIEIRIDKRKVRIEGRVQVEEARIEPRDLSAAVQRSPDARVISGAGGSAEKEGWSISSMVTVDLSEQVFFKGFGLESQVVGSLSVVDGPESVTTATGELETVDGTYQVYGRALQIRRGRLLFSGGPIANPGLDVLATRKAGTDVEVGVMVRATLKSPEITLYSEPSLPPSQTLSYLLVGQPLADIGSADRQLVSDTATRLASAGGGLLAQQLGRRFGLEDLTIASSGDGQQAALVIGKYLSPRLYASYGVGLFEPVNTLRLRYLLSSKWTLRAESGINQSADLEYSLER